MNLLWHWSAEKADAPRRDKEIANKAARNELERRIAANRSTEV
jgi:hypothetical protein